MREASTGVAGLPAVSKKLLLQEVRTAIGPVEAIEDCKQFDLEQPYVEEAIKQLARRIATIIGGDIDLLQAAMMTAVMLFYSALKQQIEIAELERLAQ